MFFVFLPGGISKEWHHIVSANCDFEGGTGPIVPIFTGLSGNTWETAKIAHASAHELFTNLVSVVGGGAHLLSVYLHALCKYDGRLELLHVELTSLYSLVTEHNIEK